MAEADVDMTPVGRAAAVPGAMPSEHSELSSGSSVAEAGTDASMLAASAEVPSGSSVAEAGTDASALLAAIAEVELGPMASSGSVAALLSRSAAAAPVGSAARQLAAASSMLLGVAPAGDGSWPRFADVAAVAGPLLAALGPRDLAAVRGAAPSLLSSVRAPLMAALLSVGGGGAGSTTHSSVDCHSSNGTGAEGASAVLELGAGCQGSTVSSHGACSRGGAEGSGSGIGVGASELLRAGREASALRALAAIVGHAVVGSGSAAGGPVGGQHRIVVLAARRLGSGSAEVRRAAIVAFVALAQGLEGPDAEDIPRLAVATLGPALGDADERVATAAARALPRLVHARGHAPAVAAARRQLRAAPVGTRRAAVGALGELAEKGDTVVVDALVVLAKCEPEWSVRLAVARAIAQVATRGDAHAYGCLEELMQDPNAIVRSIASGAIVHVASSPSDPFNIGPSPLHLAARGRLKRAPNSTPPPVPLPPSKRRRPSAAPVPATPAPRALRAAPSEVLAVDAKRGG
eukprot:CAMPEP_0203900750 /NCGR_PEP_ID=MMETSP0359-20131031/42978_1 /ASSEMBLY_ACC=CAM_ASM_000338 /TAXON_ID=268821 /ORGANISM="Scrippsiella Hangoei, Strain SHTV-5" /LENGTH=519 /DNA_ID=CAMNT_0050824271 /DNA_START=19 /DNA_END=1574 /DNA_ORIENTATION=+